MIFLNWKKIVWIWTFISGMGFDSLVIMVTGHQQLPCLSLVVYGGHNYCCNLSNICWRCGKQLSGLSGGRFKWLVVRVDGKAAAVLVGVELLIAVDIEKQFPFDVCLPCLDIRWQVWNTTKKKISDYVVSVLAMLKILKPYQWKEVVKNESNIWYV